MAALVADYDSSGSEKEDAITDSDENDSEITTGCNNPENRNIVSPSVKIVPEDFFALTDLPVQDKHIENIHSHKKHVKKSKKKSVKAIENPMRRGNRTGADATASVFYNPFLKQKEAKMQILEKHVKLTENPKDIMEINGKRICWNYRKGRCKFGHNCKFAHDSDIIGTPDAASGELPIPSVITNDGQWHEGPECSEETTVEKKRKKPGLGEGLVPGKKVQKLYKHQQSKETPWLLKR